MRWRLLLLRHFNQRKDAVQRALRQPSRRANDRRRRFAANGLGAMAIVVRIEGVSKAYRLGEANVSVRGWCG